MLDPSARELAKAAEIEEWIAQQHREGTAHGNPNFIVVPDAWRDRIAARQDAAVAAAAAADAAQAAQRQAAAEVVLHYAAEPDLELLSVGLPAGWAALWDAASGDVYYGNAVTQVCSSSGLCALGRECM